MAALNMKPKSGASKRIKNITLKTPAATPRGMPEDKKTEEVDEGSEDFEERLCTLELEVGKMKARSNRNISQDTKKTGDQSSSCKLFTLTNS